MKIPVQAGHFHAVRFYESADALARIVGDFVAEGLIQGLPGVVIATPEHQVLIEAHLHGRGFDLDRLKTNDDLLVVDAHELLAKFMVDGMPDRAFFRAAMIPIIERACRGRENCVIRAYGEMVDVLWQAGHTVAATKLEMLWNDLATTHDFSLLCGYAMGQFYKHAGAEDIYNLHSHVVSAAGEAAPVNLDVRPPTPPTLGRTDDELVRHQPSSL